MELGQLHQRGDNRFSEHRCVGTGQGYHRLSWRPLEPAVDHPNDREERLEQYVEAQRGAELDAGASCVR